MPNAPDDPPSQPARSGAGSAARSAVTQSTEAPSGHLVCAYSPRWLSGPTPAFEGLVATRSPSDGDHSDDTDHR